MSTTGIFKLTKGSIKARLVSILAVIFIIIGIATSIMNVKVVDNQIQHEINARVKTIVKAFKYNVASKINDLKIAQSFILNDQTTQKLFAAGNREALTKKYLNLFEYTLKPRFKVNVFQFHNPDATSFLRIHKPEKYGDDLSGFRKTVLKANQTKTIQAGIEVGKYGASIRVVYPVEYEKQHIGTVEIGTDYISLMNNIASSMNVDYAIGISDAVLKKAGFKLDVQTVQKGSTLFYSFSTEMIKNVVKQYQDFSTEIHFLDVQDKNIAASSFPLVDFSGTEIGSVIISSDITHEVNVANSQARMRIVLLLLMLIGVAIIIYFILIGFVFKPLDHAIESMEIIAEGDLTNTMTYDKDDEIGRLSRALNKMAQHLRMVVTDVRAKSEGLSTAAKNFSSVSKDMTSNASNLSEKSTSVSSAAEEMNANMATIATAASESSSNIQNISNTTAEMTSTVTEISQNTAQAQQISNNAVEAANNASLKINQLNTAAEDISRVIEVINDIADQTKLLALNATIEAARAGEAGKGFAVVANEVKELARQTNEATQGITGKIQAMQSSTHDSVGEINIISEVITNINEIITGIASAVEEQAVTTHDISGNIEHAAKGVADVNHSVSESVDATRLVAQDIVDVSSAASEVENGSSRVEEGVQNILHMSQELEELVENFKL